MSISNVSFSFQGASLAGLNVTQSSSALLPYGSNSTQTDSQLLSDRSLEHSDKSFNVSRVSQGIQCGEKVRDSSFETLVRKVIQSVKDHPFLFCGSLTAIYVASEIYSLLFEPIPSIDYDNLFQQLICEWFGLMTRRQAHRIYCLGI